MKIKMDVVYALELLGAMKRLRAEKGNPIKSITLSEETGISHHFSEQMLGKLRRAGVVVSLRGHGGGYYCNVEKIKLKELFTIFGSGMVVHFGKKTTSAVDPLLDAVKVFNAALEKEIVF